MPVRSGSPHKLLKLILGIIVIAAIDFFFIWNMHSKVVTNATTHQPERYSELYFTSPSNLPSQVKAGQALPVSFTLHNVESEQYSYTYTIDFTTSSGKTTVLSRGSLTLDNNAVAHISQSEHLPTFTGRGEVSVIIANQPESIHFWVEDSAQ